MTRARRTVLSALSTAVLLAAVAVPASAGNATAGSSRSVAASAALPALVPGDWTAARNKPAGGGWEPGRDHDRHRERGVPACGAHLRRTGQRRRRSGRGHRARDLLHGRCVRWSGGARRRVRGAALVGEHGQRDGRRRRHRGLHGLRRGDGQGWTGPPRRARRTPRAPASSGGTSQSPANLLSIASPTLVGSRVLVAYNAKVASNGPSFVASFDAETGRKVWQRELPLPGRSRLAVPGVRGQRLRRHRRGHHRGRCRAGPQPQHGPEPVDGQPRGAWRPASCSPAR